MERRPEALMSRQYPFAMEFVDRELVSIPRDVGQGVTVPQHVRVDVPLYRKSVAGLTALPENQRKQATNTAVEEAKLVAYEKFVLSLQIIAEYEPYFRLDGLREHAAREYLLLLPPSHWSHLRLQVALPGRGRSLHARFDEFAFEILSHSRLHGNEAYLVSNQKYQLYLHVREGGDEIRISRSEFLDRSPTSSPPIALQAHHVLTGLAERDRLAAEPDAVEEPCSIPATQEDKSLDDGAVCPDCGGVIHHFSSHEAFCLDCAWDNLSRLSELGPPKREPAR
jgi:hypothetical protein